MTILLALWSFIAIGVIGGSTPKHALNNECASYHLNAGSYRCIVDGQCLYMDCMVDGTMYINAEQQALYHYYKQTQHEMKFELMLSANYKSIEDVDEALIKSFALRSAADSNIDGEADTDGELNDESLESEELTEPEKRTVNLTAQYIVYAVIIVMAIVFTLGVSALIYCWCCRGKCAWNKSDDEHRDLLIDETTPFIDIRGSATLQKKSLHHRVGRSVYLQSGTHAGVENEQMDELHRDRHNIYDDIDGADDSEDGDDLIAHYGATNNENSSGYIIAQVDGESASD
eukprot:CAMPEP_0197075690 /NCGR_PEP_ID=MMETSP1384-20130603/211736_1 /TAXON_ID=29189 /ORGANISM="Ammonia sp." /LENGTH=286 /DNA_ID=CAMNT_0042514539 /DNA_START=106 /DNA_END=966 /DNA_ORIENTATION=-